jgi:hypothetical protein
MHYDPPIAVAFTNIYVPSHFRIDQRNIDPRYNFRTANTTSSTNVLLAAEIMQMPPATGRMQTTMTIRVPNSQWQ